MTKPTCIVFSAKQLQSMNPSDRAMKFVKRFLRLTNQGPAKIDFTKDELKIWLFPQGINRPQIAHDILKLYSKAKKYEP